MLYIYTYFFTQTTDRQREHTARKSWKGKITTARPSRRLGLLQPITLRNGRVPGVTRAHIDARLGTVPGWPLGVPPCVTVSLRRRLRPGGEVYLPSGLVCAKSTSASSLFHLPPTRSAMSECSYPSFLVSFFFFSFSSLFLRYTFLPSMCSYLYALLPFSPPPPLLLHLHPPPLFLLLSLVRLPSSRPPYPH